MPNQDLEIVPFNKDPKKDKRFSNFFSLFLRYKDIRNQKVRFFNKNGVARNIIDYVKDGVDRMNERHLKPAHKEDWQNNVFDPITRDKLITILSLMAAARMKPQVLVNLGSLFSLDDAELRQNILSDLLEHANMKNEDEQQLIWEMYTAMSEGTIIGFEGWKKDMRDVEYVEEYNPDTGEKKTTTVTIEAWDDVFGEIIPIDEWYPETIWTHDLKNIKRSFWVREMTLESFRDNFKQFPGADKVLSAGEYRNDEKLPWGISEDIRPRNVEVTMWFDESGDRHGIWANGVELYWGCLPWNHKKMPIWLAQFEPIHHQFIYGKSLPDKLMGMQDVDNAVLNGMLDQLFLALNSPVFIDGMSDDLDEGYLEPGRLYKVDPGTQVQQANVGKIDQSAFSMLQLIKRSMEESTISAQAQGVPTGGRKTKFEVQQLQEGALNLAGLFLQMMENSMKNKYWLRLANILQYYAMPSRDKSGKAKFRFITMDDRKLRNGKIGKRLIQVVNSSADLPEKGKLQEVAARVEGKDFDIMESRVEPIAITRDYLLNKDYTLDLRIVPNSSVKESEAMKKNKDIAFFQATVNNPLVDQEANLRDFARAFNKPDEIIKKQTDGGQEALAPGGRGLPGLPGGTPGQGQQPNLNLL